MLFFLFFCCYIWYKAVKLSDCNLWQRTWNHVFFYNRSSWETIFSKSTEVVTPEQLQCCRRIVQLCKHCLLVVYKYSSDSRGSPTGISPYWDDTRYTFQLFFKPCSLCIKKKKKGKTPNISLAPEFLLLWSL